MTTLLYQPKVNSLSSKESGEVSKDCPPESWHLFNNYWDCMRAKDQYEK